MKISLYHAILFLSEKANHLGEKIFIKNFDLFIHRNFNLDHQWLNQNDSEAPQECI